MHLDDIFEQLMYRGHPLGRLISGTRATVQGITRTQLAAYRDRHYDPSQLVLTLAGNLGDHVGELVRGTFGKERTRSPRAAHAGRYTKMPSGPAVRLHWKETTQAHFALGVPTYAAEHPKTFPLALLANILGGTMSSRLFIAVRERRGLAYSVRASAEAYVDTGSLVITAGLDPARLPTAMRVILREIERIRDRGVTVEELSRAKENIEGRIVLALEESSARADWFGKQALLRKDILTPEEKIVRLAAVERSAVQAVAREIFRTDRLHLAIIGAYKDEAPFKKLLKL